MLRVLLLVSFMTETIARGTYVVSFPNYLLPGIPLKIRVQTINANGAVDIDASLRHVGNNSLIRNATSTIGSASPVSMELKVPDNLMPSKYNIFVRGTGGITFCNESTIYYENDSLFVFIQTDKSRYSAGQLVRFRAIFILPNLLSYIGNATIIVQDGRGNKINVIGPLQVQNGVISDQLLISEKPVFGKWKITVQARGKSTSKFFEVFDYILPKFLVNVKVPEIVKVTQTSLPIDIEARFTFNADVFGNCTIVIYNNGMTWRNLIMSKEIKGNARFTIPMSKFTHVLDVYSKINVRATVTDHATSYSMVAEREIKILTMDSGHRNKPSIRKLDVKDSFIPGLTYETNLFIGYGDEPLGTKGFLYITSEITESKLSQCNTNSAPYTWLEIKKVPGPDMKVPFDVSGIAKLSIPTSYETEHISLKLLYNGTGKISLETLELFAVSNKNLTLLQVYSENVNAEVGDKILLNISSTEELDGHLEVTTYARGMLLNTETLIMNKEKYKQHSLAAIKDMIPQAYIIFSHLTKTGKFVSDYITVKVSGDPLKNKMSVEYSKTELKPGENIKIDIKADPHSKVYILVEDERNRILGTENDLFPGEVTELVVHAGHNVEENIHNFYTRSSRDMKMFEHGFIFEENDLMQHTSVRGDERSHLTHKRSHGELGDLDDVYIESGLVVLTNAEVFDKNNKFDLRMYNRSFPLECTSGMTPTAQPGLVSGQSPTAQPGLLSGQPPTDVLHLGDLIRSRFPETWLWDEYNVGVSGNISIEKVVPDSITTWVTSVFSTNQHTGFGITQNKSQFTVKKGFFITMDMPHELVHGEEFLLQLSVFNYMSRDQQVFLQTVLSDAPSDLIPAATVVKAGEGHSTYIHITPKTIGTLQVTVLAKAGTLFSTTATDHLTKNITVRPNGVLKTSNEQHLIDVTNKGSPFVKTVYLHDPRDMVPGTKEMLLSISGNIMIQSIEGLHNLIRMPYGCGEQTMLNFAPAIYITKYLKTVGKLTNAFEANSKEVLNSGLQRELRYQHHDGSFSAFGNKDHSGSTWLSAFVVKCFRQADGLINIDPSVTSRAIKWLLRHQNNDGSFSEPGRIIHTQMQSGTASGVKLTAFTLISLLENRNKSGVQSSKMENAIRKGKSFLQQKLTTVHDMYALSILCYALATAERTPSATCLTKLREKANHDGDKMFWFANTKTLKRTVTSPRANSLDIITSSYALLTYLRLGKGTEALPIVKWLLSQRNPTGGFQSTQDTIISLQALSDFSAMYLKGPSKNYNIKFQLFGEYFSHSYTVTSSSFDIMHKKKLPFALSNMTMQATGEGTAMIDIAMSYYVSGNTADNHIAVAVKIIKEEINSVTVKPCISWIGQTTSGMLVSEVEMPTGFQPDGVALKTQNAIKLHETIGRNIVLYFDGIKTGGQVCVEVKMDRVDAVVKSQACHVTVYDYYEPTHQAMERYEFGLLKNSTICSVCPMCTFCTGSTVGQIGVGK